MTTYSSHADTEQNVAEIAGYCLLVLLPFTLILSGFHNLQSLVFPAEFLQTYLQLLDVTLSCSIVVQ